MGGASLFLLVAALAAHRSTAEQPRERWVSIALAEAMSEFEVSSDPNSDCTRHSRLYLESLANSTLWAVTMLDSSSVSVGGVLSGDLYSLGHYDQCLAVRVPGARLQAQYCLATLQYGPDPQARPAFYEPPADTYHEPPGTASVWEKVKVTLDPSFTRRDVVHWGLCVPASCSASDVQDSLNTSLTAVFTKYGLQASVSVDPRDCYNNTDQQTPPPTAYFITKTAMYMYLLLSVIATVYDYIVQYYRDTKLGSRTAEMLEKMLLAFSLRKNMNGFTEKGANPKLDVLNGGKVISIAAILFGHRFLYSFGNSLQNKEYFEKRYDTEFAEIFIMNATHLVDIFFASSGFLAFLGIYNTLEKRKSINIPLVVLLRWLRIVPPYLMMMGVVGWLLPLMGDGPLWRQRVGLESARCQENWWLNLLFINNYVNADGQCLLLSWYLACDMQYFVVAVFAIYVLWRWKRLGFVLFAFFLAASIAVPFYVTYEGRFYGTLRLYAPTLLVDPSSNSHYTEVYVKSHNRAGPYIIGVITGYLVTRLSQANYKFSSRTILVGFLLLFGGGYAHQAYSFLFYQRDRPFSPLENALFAAFHRITFSIGTAWIIMGFYLTGFELFRILLAQPVFTPLSKLIFGLVLIHPTVQLASSSSMRHTETLTYTRLIWMACGDYMVSNLLALPLYLMVEAPTRTIVKLVFMGETRKPATEEQVSQNKHPEIIGELPKQVIISRL